MGRSIGTLLGGALLLLAAMPAAAGSLRIAPVRVEVAAPGGAATLTLRNDQKRPVATQFRIFRWSQADGVERLDPTADVVVSPPFATIAHGEEYVLRIVRVTRRPVAAEESYRVLVDELPQQAGSRSGTVRFLLRYSIPVFFAPEEAGEANVGWSVRRRGKDIVVAAENAGSRRLQVSNLRLRDARGVIASLREGLVGYVLGGAAMRWTFSGVPVGRLSGDAVRLIADTDARPVDAAIPFALAR